MKAKPFRTIRAWLAGEKTHRGWKLLQIHLAEFNKEKRPAAKAPHREEK